MNLPSLNRFGGLRLLAAPIILLLITFLASTSTIVLAQSSVDFSRFNKKGSAKASVNNDLLEITWPAGAGGLARLLLNTAEKGTVVKSIQLESAGKWKEIAFGVE